MSQMDYLYLIHLTLPQIQDESASDALTVGDLSGRSEISTKPEDI
jgi:hypothetical protein